MVVLFLAALALLFFATPKPVDPVAQATEAAKVQALRSKWTIEYEGEFEDSRAYTGWHRIYRLKHADGTELICVTGVGLERGSHGSGRTTVGDER